MEQMNRCAEKSKLLLTEDSYLVRSQKQLKGTELVSRLPHVTLLFRTHVGTSANDSFCFAKISPFYSS